MSFPDAETFARDLDCERGAPTRGQILRLFNLLPWGVPPRGAPQQKVPYFACGAYSQGGLQGIRGECDNFPMSVRAITAFVRAQVPGHPFTTVALFQNTQTDVHVDSRNAPLPNAVIAVSQFKNGQVWVGDGEGPVVRTINGARVPGSLLPVAEHPVTFDAFRFPHCTEQWTGERIVAVAFSVSSLARLSPNDIEQLRQLGFILHQSVLAAPARQDTPPVLSSSLWTFEIFSGHANLSRALWNVGFHVLSFDSAAVDGNSPTVRLDLSTEAGQDVFWKLLEAHKPFFFHLGVPCGTASRARERPLPEHHVLAARPPQPLRSSEFPLGLPTLPADSKDSWRVRTANVLYKFSYRLLLHCCRFGIACSVENPTNSLFWQVLESFAEQENRLWPPAQLEYVDFHSCCHGGSRPKKTRLLATKGLFTQLRAVCQKDHPHKPWSLIYRQGSTVFSTADEASYPPLLCKRMADLLLQSAQSRGFSLVPASPLHAQSQASLGKQSRKMTPLIPEFYRVVWKPASFVPDSSCKILLRHSEGGGGKPKEIDDSMGDDALQPPAVQRGGQGKPEEIDNSMGDDALQPPATQRAIKVGFWLNPQQHVQEATKLEHPVDVANPVDEVAEVSVKACMDLPKRELMHQRKLNLLKATLLVKQLDQKEAELHDSFPPWYRKVVADKKILAWEALLQTYGYSDMEAVNFLRQGVRLVGESDLPECFKPKLVPATMSEAELRDTAKPRRQAMRLSRHASDEDHVKHLHAATDEEVSLGFLEGPYDEDEVSAILGHDSWGAIRRFILVQGAELKLRPIDDGLEAQINAAYTSLIKLEMQDSDYIASLAKKIGELERLRAERLGCKPRPWKGKTLDLTKAYKQLPLHPEHRDLAVVYFRGEGGKDCYYISNALLFGSSAAVFAFNRVARSLWYLINKILLLPCGYFYDDFPLFSLAEDAEEMDEMVTEFLHLLGWRHATTGSKGKAFSEVFTVLGMQLDLSCLDRGTIVLANKPGRIERIVELLNKCKARGFMSRHEAQVLLGLLNFAAGFYAGQALRPTCCDLNAIISGASIRHGDLARMCDHATVVLRETSPRIISSLESRPLIHIWTDGSWEQGVAGLGAVVYDCESGQGAVFQGTLPQNLVDHWKAGVGSQLICEIELFAIVAIRSFLMNKLAGRKCIFWTDNDSARAAMIKGYSSSLAMHVLVRRLASIEAGGSCIRWVERVPSFSNISDWPSRGEGGKALELVNAKKVESFPFDRSLIEALLTDDAS